MKAVLFCAAAVAAVLSTSAQAAVLFTPKALVIAGGGGGGAVGQTAGDGQVGTSGGDGGGSGGKGGIAGAGGAGGIGRSIDDDVVGGAAGGGGAGLNSGGGNGSSTGREAAGGSTSPTYAGGLGFTGGPGGVSRPLASLNGGFGGGGGAFAEDRFGSAAGGGGGYSGGGGGGTNGRFPVAGGGGGSFLDASMTAFSTELTALRNTTTAQFAGSRTGANGFVTITNLLNNQAFTFGSTGAVQSYTFDTSGLYSIVAAGAQGGNAGTRNFLTFGGVGAVMAGQREFTAGSTLNLIVGGGGGGGGGGENSATFAGGGGGGTFVFLTGIGDPVAAVPEPATWAMTILGFGLVGGTMRRRKTPVATRVSYAA